LFYTLLEKNTLIVKQDPRQSAFAKKILRIWIRAHLWPMTPVWLGRASLKIISAVKIHGK